MDGGSVDIAGALYRPSHPVHKKARHVAGLLIWSMPSRDPRSLRFKVSWIMPATLSPGEELSVAYQASIYGVYQMGDV